MSTARPPDGECVLVLDGEDASPLSPPTLAPYDSAPRRGEPPRMTYLKGSDADEEPRSDDFVPHHRPDAPPRVSEIVRAVDAAMGGPADAPPPGRQFGSFIDTSTHEGRRKRDDARYGGILRGEVTVGLRGSHVSAHADIAIPAAEAPPAWAEPGVRRVAVEPVDADPILRDSPGLTAMASPPNLRHNEVIVWCDGRAFAVCEACLRVLATQPDRHFRECARREPLTPAREREIAAASGVAEPTAATDLEGALRAIVASLRSATWAARALATLPADVLELLYEALAFETQMPTTLYRMSAAVQHAHGIDDSAEAVAERNARFRIVRARMTGIG